MNDTQSYCAARAREERQRAAASSDPDIAKVHEELANEYEARLQDTEVFGFRDVRALAALKGLSRKRCSRSTIPTTTVACGICSTQPGVDWCQNLGPRNKVAVVLKRWLELFDHKGGSL